MRLNSSANKITYLISDHLLLILKQISLLLETLPELMNLKTALLAQDIK